MKYSVCLKNKIKLIYSATSASLGNKGNDKTYLNMHLLKQKFKLLNNLKQWFSLNLEVIYFLMFMDESNIQGKNGNRHWNF